MLNQGIVSGVQQNAPSTAPITQRFGGDGGAIVSELRAKYSRGTLDGNRFWVASQAVATTTVGLATTYTGLVIANPINSPTIMLLDIASVMQSVIQSVQPEAYALAFGFNKTTNVTLTTPATTQSSKLGSGLTSNGVAATSATLPTAPLYGAFVHNTSSATTNGTGQVIDLGGAVALLPGAYALWVTPAQASVAGLWFSFSWEEVPLNA